MIKTIEYDSKIGDIVRSTFHELEYLRNVTDSCKSKFLNYFQNKLSEYYFFTLYNCFQSNIDKTDIYNVDIIYRSAIKYVKDTMQCTENNFIFLLLNDYLEMLNKSYQKLIDCISEEEKTKTSSGNRCVKFCMESQNTEINTKN